MICHDASNYLQASSRSQEAKENIAANMSTVSLSEEGALPRKQAKLAAGQATQRDDSATESVADLDSHPLIAQFCQAAKAAKVKSVAAFPQDWCQRSDLP